MKLHHIGFWTKDIEKQIAFYQKYFDGQVLFRHQSGDFCSAFVRICGSVNLELMTRSALNERVPEERVGYSHFSIEVDSKEEVDRLTDLFIADNVTLEKNKEQYDDGFYESAVIDPDGNLVEIAFVDHNVNSAV